MNNITVTVLPLWAFGVIDYWQNGDQVIALLAGILFPWAWFNGAVTLFSWITHLVGA